MWYTLGVGISWDLTIQFDSDSEVNDSILNRLLMHLDATIFFVYISMHDFKKKMLPYSFGFQRSWCWSYRLGASHCSYFGAAQTQTACACVYSRKPAGAFWTELNVAAGELISILKFRLLTYLHRHIIILERIAMHRRVEIISHP